MSISLSAILPVVHTAAPSNTPPSQPGPIDPGEGWIVALFAMGVCTLGVWILRRVINPRKLSLEKTPGRPSELTPVHVIAVLGAWTGLLWITGRVFPQRNERGELIAMALAHFALLAGSLVVAALTFRHGLRRGMGLTMRHWVFDTVRGVTGYLTVIPICLALYWAIPRTPEDKHVILRMLPDLPGLWKTATILTVVVLTPLGEEVFFRGLVQSTFRRYFRWPWIGIVATSIIFALVHQPLWKDMPALFALSIALGYNYERCGRLYPSILIHAIFNAVNIAWTLTSGG